MSAYTDALAETTSKTGVPCKTCKILKRLDPDIRSEVVADIGQVSDNRVARALTKIGHEVSQSSIQKHRVERHGE